MEILCLISGENKLCSYADLQTLYNTEDAYDMLEIQAVNAAIEEDMRKRRSQGQ